MLTQAGEWCPCGYNRPVPAATYPEYVPLARPDHLTHTDLIQAARILVGRHQDAFPVDWHTSPERLETNHHIRTELDSHPAVRHDPLYAQEVFKAFLPDTLPKTMVRHLSQFGLQVGLTGRTATNPAASDADILAGLHILDHHDRWVDHMRILNMSPLRTHTLLTQLTHPHTGHPDGHEVLDLGIRLHMDDDWFTATAADPNTVDLPALRTMHALLHANMATPDRNIA